MGERGPPPPQAVEELARRVRALREGLQRSGANTDLTVAALDSVRDRVAAIDAEIRPVQVRAHAANMAHVNIDRAIDVTQDILAQFDIVERAEAMITKGPHEDLERYLEAVDQLKGVVRFFESIANSRSREGVLNRIDGLLTKAMQKIEDEFRKLMHTYSKPIEPNLLLDCLSKIICTSNGAPEAVEEQPPQSSALSGNPTLIPPRVLPLLHNMAHQLVQEGNHESCYRIYRDARVSVLELSLRKLGVEELNNNDVQRMEWEALKTKIGNWNQIMQIAVKVLLAGEKENCVLVFDGISFHKDQCFAEVADISFMTLLRFGDAVAKCKMSPEKLPVLLDMYGVMHELHLEVEVIFQGRLCSEMREAALNLTKSLAQTAHDFLVDFVEAVEKDSKNNIQDGNVHPLTIQVISCAESLFDYRSTLEILEPFEIGSATESQLAVVTVKILQALENNLGGRFKMYKDSAWSYIFLMNNIYYVVMSIRRLEAKDILINNWIEKHRRLVWKNAGQYPRVALETIPKILSVSSLVGAGSSGSDLRSTGVSKKHIKERFKSFNRKFEEIHATQSKWNVPNMELRVYLRVSISQVLVPAYRSFVNHFGDIIQRGKNPHKYMKHSAEEVEKMVGEFFGGKEYGEESSED